MIFAEFNDFSNIKESKIPLGDLLCGKRASASLNQQVTLGMKQDLQISPHSFAIRLSHKHKVGKNGTNAKFVFSCTGRERLIQTRLIQLFHLIRR